MIPLRDLNPTRTFPFVTLLLILANSAVFLFEVTLRPRVLDQFTLAYGAIPFEISHNVDLAPKIALPVYVTLLISMFIHGGWLHIIGNMLYLWIFGNNIEDRFGHAKFLAIYLIWGVVAGLTQVLIGPNERTPAVGASGAIAGVLGAYLVIFPRARVDTLLTIGIFFTAIQLPAILVIGQWIVIQFFNGFLSLGASAGQEGVAYFAHIGGAVAGIVVGLVYRALGPPAPTVYSSAPRL